MIHDSSICDCKQSRRTPWNRITGWRQFLMKLTTPGSHQKNLVEIGQPYICHWKKKVKSILKFYIISWWYRQDLNFRYFKGPLIFLGRSSFFVDCSFQPCLTCQCLNIASKNDYLLNWAFFEKVNIAFMA